MRERTMITDAAADKRYAIYVGPGTYTSAWS
jgi:hypothetical protein